MSTPEHQRILPHFDISEQGLRELEIWLNRRAQELQWGPWIYVGSFPIGEDTTKLSPAFQNGWQNVGGGQQRLRFRRTMPTKNKKVQSLEIEGDISNSGTVTNSVIFTLPAGYRPAENSGPVLAANTDDQVVVWQVATNGDVSYLDLAAAGTTVTFATPALVLGTTAAAGATDQVIRKDATIIAFDATVPSTQAFGDSAATGSAAVAARRDHKHAMPANPFTGAAAGGSLSGTYPNPGIAAGAVGAPELASTAVTPGSYGDATHAGAFTVDADGRLTAASSVAVTASSTSHILLADGHATPFAFTDLLQMDDGSDFMWSE